MTSASGKFPADRQQKQPRPRGTGKRFEPGQSGNPEGRKPGSRNRVTILGEKILLDDADAIVQAVVDAAKAGDMQAARLCVERLIPVRRGRPVTFPLPPIKSADDVGQAFSAIVEAMSKGDLTPEEAGAVAAVIELRRKAIETSELEKRIAALETPREPDQ